MSPFRRKGEVGRESKAEEDRSNSPSPRTWDQSARQEEAGNI